MGRETPNKVMVVGANGFVGRSLISNLQRHGDHVIAASRNNLNLPDGVEWYSLQDLTSSDLSWAALPKQIDQIVFLAARVHVMNDTHPEPLRAYRAINHDAALSLAHEAYKKKVKRFVYISSVKVNGESSQRSLTETDVPNPSDAYGISKYEAEVSLLEFGQQTGLEVVIIRPPLVYGAGVQANFMSLAKAVGRGIPLPIGAINNKRSMIYVENLTDFIVTALNHPKATGEVFLVSDGEDISTPELTRRLAEGQGRTAYLPAVPVKLLKLAGTIVGRADIIDRLTDSLTVSIGKAQDLLGWQPPYPVWHALARTGQHLKAETDATVEVYNLSIRQRIYLVVRTNIERLLALVLLLVLLPLLITVGLLIHLDSTGPSLFTQERAGHYHHPFKIYKFRTMRTNAPSLSTEEMQLSGLNPITRLGSLLRRTSLDELPQLINVIKGEMSFIGPRPALLSQTPVLTLREKAGVHQLLPGITGYAQATGRDDLTDSEKVKRDLYYLKNLGLRMDVRIVRLTLQSVLKGTGNK